MAEKGENPGKKPPRPQEGAFPRERAAFKALVLSNPNYFGNLVDSPLEAVLSLSNNTFYENLGCLGYQPQQEQLEAVVYINQPSGYGSDICGPGSPEYVRFYLDFGAGWQDQGLTSFQAYNIPEGTEGGKRLEYAVSLKVDPPRKFCLFDPVIRARAILSWNNPPPPNQPNWVPIWGNVQTENILVEPFRFIWPLDLFAATDVKLPPDFAEVLDLKSPIATKAQTLGAVELARRYREQNVPVHRYAFKELHSFLSAQTALSAEALQAQLPGIEITPEIGDLILTPTDGNISFEELHCIGLDPNAPNTLVGVIEVKQPTGFSGGPCTDGSREYVTFWADFNGDGTLETCLGTTSVQVYDLNNFPLGGVYYAVRLPVNLDQYRRVCAEGPVVVRVRAILSWNVPVNCANPNQVPVWGNREETLIHIAPAAQAPAGKIAILGGIPVSHIDDLTGLTDASAVFALNNIPPDSLGRPCPFGGRVSAQGAPVNNFSYVVEVSPDGLVWTPQLTNLTVTDLNGNTSTHSANPATLRFDYLDFTQNVNSLLAHWNSTGDALWFIRLSVYDGPANDLTASLVGTDTHRIQLDNTGPESSIEITSGAGNCGKFKVGDVLAGNFVATDLYLGSYSLGVEPVVAPPGPVLPVPSSGLVNTPPAPDGWTLNTGGMNPMAPCGYVIRVVAVDRAILNSQSVGHWSSDSAGFCLE